MQASTATTATTTFSAHPRRTNAPSHNRNRNHGPAPTRVSARPNLFQLLAKPAQPASSKDFYLDTLFNPVWMSGPHVFSFAKDGTVVRPETYRTEPYPGHLARAASSSGRNVCGATLSSASASSSAPSTPSSKASGRSGKDWKNVAISEQDDAEFAAREVWAQAEAKGKLVGLVHTWPPKPLPAPCTGCEVLAVPRRRMEVEVGAGTGTGTGTLLSVGTGTQESAVPALTYGSSRGSESESEVFRVVPGRGDAVCRKAVPLEKSVGFGRLERKAPGPVLLVGMEEGEGESGKTVLGVSREVGKDCDEGLSMVTAEPWAEDKLTVSFKAMLRMHEV